MDREEMVEVIVGAVRESLLSYERVPPGKSRALALLEEAAYAVPLAAAWRALVELGLLPQIALRVRDEDNVHEITITFPDGTEVVRDFRLVREV